MKTETHLRPKLGHLSATHPVLILLPHPQPLHPISSNPLRPPIPLPTRLPHPLKTPPHTLLDLHPPQINRIFPTLRLQLPRIEHAITPPGFNDVGLLLQSEVLPGEGWAHDVPVEGQDFVVGDGARVGEVVDAEFGVRG